jgi:hypothetical protein
MNVPPELPPRDQTKRRGKQPSCKASAKGDAFAQHRVFVQAWHRRLQSGAISVWHYLWDICHRDGRFQYVSTARIAERTGVHDRTARRCVRRLEALSLLEVARPKNMGRGHALGFRIPAQLPSPPEE